MAEPSSIKHTSLFGLWLGGFLEELRPVRYLKKDTDEERQFQVARFHVPGEEARYQTVNLDETTRFDLPRDTPVLVNVRTYISDTALRLSLAKDYPGRWWMPSLAAPDKDGVDAAMVGLFACGRFHSTPKREWRDQTSGKMQGIRYLKLHVPRPVEPDYLMLELDPAMTLPEFKPGQEITVPVSAAATKRGVRFRLLREFQPIEALTAPDDAGSRAA